MLPAHLIPDCLLAQVRFDSLSSASLISSLVVVVSDHLSLPHLTGMNPLLGPPLSSSYPRFMPLSDAYSTGLRRLAFLAANHLSLEPDALEEGVYAWVSGPTYETPAEGRFLRNAGADVVGMSTVPEVVVARQEGLNVMVLTLVTNAVVIPDFRSIKAEVKAEVCLSHPFFQLLTIQSLQVKRWRSLLSRSCRMKKF